MKTRAAVFIFFLIVVFVFSSCTLQITENTVTHSGKDEVVIHEVHSDDIMTVDEIAAVAYENFTVTEDYIKVLPEGLLNSVAIPLQNASGLIVFAFFPEESTLVLLFTVTYYVPEDEFLSVGTNRQARSIALTLTVPYKNTEELLAQDYWSGTVKRFCIIDAIKDQGVAHANLPIGDLPPDQTVQKNCYGCYYPNLTIPDAEIPRKFTENPAFGERYARPWLGFYVIAEENFEQVQVFREIFDRYDLFPLRKE